jgi:putative glutamine amidotransferase
MRPLIGITCRFNPGSRCYNLREGYADAICAAGGAPVLLPLIPERGYIESLIDKLDAVCLSGSDSDIDPIRYGREPLPQCGAIVERRDQTDMLILEAAEAKRLPVLGICFGIQSMNVYRGGTLIQDISAQVKGAIKHRQDNPWARHCHSINIARGSLLEELAGSARALVNSHHHQAIETLGRDLEPIAWAPDGIIEAVINRRDDQFMLGLQWHPEMGWEEDPLSQAIFNYFVSAARGRAIKLAR